MLNFKVLQHTDKCAEEVRGRPSGNRWDSEDGLTAFCLSKLQRFGDSRSISAKAALDLST